MHLNPAAFDVNHTSVVGHDAFSSCGVWTRARFMLVEPHAFVVCLWMTLLLAAPGAGRS
jgi:hypothetical protein